MTRLTGRLRDQVELETVASDVVAIGIEALQPARADVWIPQPVRLR